MRNLQIYVSDLLHILYASLHICTRRFVRPQDMMTNVKKERLHSDHAKADAFIFTILSHGGRGFVYCSDGQKLVLEQLYELFDGNECPALIGKPKIFIIQACQGSKIRSHLNSE